MGIFFILDKFTTSNNTMFVVIFLSFLGFVILQSASIDLVDYTKVEKINSTHTQFVQEDISSNGMGIANVQSFLVLVMWFFMILAIINITLGKEYGK